MKIFVLEVLQNSMVITCIQLFIRKNNYQEKQVALGQLAVQKILANQQSEAIETRMVELEQEYMNVQQEERDIVQKLNEKYGPGQLDPQTGVFTPVPTETEATE